VRYGCLKISRCSEDSFRVGKHGSTWDSGNIRKNATWDTSKLKYRGKLSFQEKNYHNFLFTTPFCMDESFSCSL
jgi:hypothetical protein